MASLIYHFIHLYIVKLLNAVENYWIKNKPLEIKLIKKLDIKKELEKLNVFPCFWLTDTVH